MITDGASALYGSDAVGGVANLILRRDCDGLQTSARVGASTQGGNVQQQYSGVGGTRWATGGFMAALDYSKATPIYADDRPYSRSLDPTQMIGTGSRQVSGVLAGHQDLASWVSSELDAPARRPPLAQGQCLFGGGAGHRLRPAQPARRALLCGDAIASPPARCGWEATLEMTDGDSDTVNTARRYIKGNLQVGRSAYDNHLTNFEAGAEGPLARLPGGEVRLAFGGGYRRFRLDFNVRSTSAGVTRVTRNERRRLPHRSRADGADRRADLHRGEADRHLPLDDL